MLIRKWVEVCCNTQWDQAHSWQLGRLLLLDHRIESGLRRKIRMFEDEAFFHQPKTFLPESDDRPFSRVHECSFAWNTKDLGKAVERNNNLNVSNDKGNGNYLVDISSDPNTLIEFEDKQRTNLFVDNKKTIKVDGGKDLANVRVIKKNNGNVKCQDEEQISMRKLEYRVKEHYERDDDDDHDGTKDL
ncbi:hypothetical protein Tco_1253372 [Tanacetum coccineum]